VKDFSNNWINWLNKVAELYLLHISLEDSEPSVLGGSNHSTDSQVQCTLFRPSWHQIYKSVLLKEI